MDLSILKNFVNHDVEVLVGGVWIEGHMTPIVKGQITLLPIGEASHFYGPMACEAAVVQAVRQVKRDTTKANAQAQQTQQSQVPIKSGFEATPGHVGQRFVIAK